MLQYTTSWSTCKCGRTFSFPVSEDRLMLFSILIQERTILFSEIFRLDSLSHHSLLCLTLHTQQIWIYKAPFVAQLPEEVPGDVMIRSQERFPCLGSYFTTAPIPIPSFDFYLVYPVCCSVMQFVYIQIFFNYTVFLQKIIFGHQGEPPQ